MILEKFVKKTHLGIIKEWLLKRDLPEYFADNLPRIGFIAKDEDEYICAAFIRCCEGQVAMFDSLISNPNAPSKSRDMGINLVIGKLIIEAKKLGFKSGMAYSVDMRTIERVQRLGFRRTEQVLFSIEL